jgi:glycosyltransferase involved in cell wall biosynthesis
VDRLRIVWFNWRCIKHPLAGGAEVYTHEIAKRLVEMGHEVVLITSRPKNLPEREEIDGYTVIRTGNMLTVYLKARNTYLNLVKKPENRPDLVIDEVNTIPFMTPSYASEPIVMLIHQLCKDCWRYAVHPLVQPIGWLVEKQLHRLYVKAAKEGRLRNIITVSPSTREDLANLGYPKSMIHIVYNGVNQNKYKDCTSLARNKSETVLYLGRIIPYKKLEDLIKAWKIVESASTNADLIIAGRPDPRYLDRLKKLVYKLGLTKKVRFALYLSHHEKKRLLAKSKILVYTSIREGWGQTILEAALCHTPTIAYKVPGLRDAVIHLKTGILVEPGDIRHLANAITTLLNDDTLREKLAKQAHNLAKQFDWDTSAKAFLSILESSL